jgi:hypothetical protein
MPDRENVIKGLNDIGVFIAGRIGIERARNFLRTIDDAVAMLKEQDAVEPIRISTNYEQHWKCGKCKAVISVQDKYCHECGKRIEWEGR